MGISVLILTLNEEDNLTTCLASLSWCDDIVVLDSFSSDRTEEIARAHGGVRFSQRKFDNYATHRNFGLKEIKYKHDWLLMVDADEVAPSALANELKQVIAHEDSEICLYHLRRKDFLFGRWLKHSSGYPTWFGRFMRLGRVWVEREINEEYHTDGKVGYLQEHLEHYPFNKGFSAWFEKHNRYSTMEAQMMTSACRQPVKISWSLLVGNDPIASRKAIKEIVYNLPGRPVFMFLALYIFRGGFLDGAPGLTFCLLRSCYEFMINCKVKEFRFRQNGCSV
jgi:glycosyltransferase involved in cell wall biosynthesis